MAKRYKVEFTTHAERDLASISDWIIRQSGMVRTALDYVRRIRVHILEFKQFPRRGTQRDDLYPGIRLIGFEGRVTIAFTVTDDTVTIIRIFYAGRDIAALFDDESGSSS